MRDVHANTSRCHKSSSSTTKHYDEETYRRKEKKHKKHKKTDYNHYEEVDEDREVKVEIPSPEQEQEGDVIEVHGSSSEGEEEQVSQENEEDLSDRKRRKRKAHQRRLEGTEERESKCSIERHRRREDSHKEESRKRSHVKEPRRYIENRRERDEDNDRRIRNEDNERRGRREDNERRDRNDRPRPIKQEKPDSDTETSRSNRRRENSRERHNNRVPREREDREDRQDRGEARGRVKEEQQDRHHDRRPQRGRSNADRRRRSSSRGEEHEWGGGSSNQDNTQDKTGPAEEKQKPNFGLSGKLTEDTNMFNGVLIKYSEPPEARMPRRRWRLYPFKGDQGLPTLYIHRQSAYLMGRDRKVVDIPIDHPSCSKQHAALQYRLVTYNRPNGTVGKQIRLYIIDLESANGTFINNKQIEAKKYVELMEKDVIKFGYSSREYVLLHEHSKGEEEHSDQDDE